METRVAIIRTGTANLASVSALFERLGHTPELVDSAAAVEGAPLLVLPGVGAFGAAMETLDARGLVGPLQRRVLEGRPLLAICLGLQLLFEASEESPGVRGLGCFPGTIRRFRPGFGASDAVEGADSHLRVPALGWNRVTPDGPARFLAPSWAYFAHSYFLGLGDPRDHGSQTVPAHTIYGAPYVSAFESGALLACQFHPELSGADGRALVSRWVDGAPREAP